MPKHIGLVGCSAEGAALCYKTICVEGAQHFGSYAHPEVSMHTHSLSRYVASLERNDLQGIADLMLYSATKLKACGADFLICPDNTIHQAMDSVEPRSPLPWLHIAEVVAQEAKAKSYKRVGLTGTRWLVESDVYPSKLNAVGIDVARPSPVDRERLGRIIMTELVHGVFERTSVSYVEGLIRQFKEEEDCDAVVLGCTEIPLIITDENSALPTLDSTRILARAALRHAMT